MKDLPVGASAVLAHTVALDKTVPQTCAEFPEFRDMPPVCATGLLVTLLETCSARLNARVAGKLARAGGGASSP